MAISRQKGTWSIEMHKITQSTGSYAKKKRHNKLVLTESRVWQQKEKKRTAKNIDTRMSNYKIKRNLTNILQLHNLGCSAWMYMLPSRNPNAQHNDYTPWTTPESTSTKSCVLSRIRVLVILIVWHNCATAFRPDSALQVLSQGGGTKYVGTLSGAVQGAKCYAFGFLEGSVLSTLGNSNCLDTRNSF